MDDFIYQIKLSQIENCNNVQELTLIFKDIFREYKHINALYGDGCVNFHNLNEDSYTVHYEAILVSALLGNIYNRLIDSKQLSTSALKLVLNRPFPPIDKEQAIKNIKAFHGLT